MPNNEDKKEIEVISGDGSNLDISPVYEHIEAVKPKNNKRSICNTISEIKNLLYNNKLIKTIIWIILLILFTITKIIYYILYTIYWIFKNILRFFLLPISIIFIGLIKLLSTKQKK